jgi:hypothetical protein
LFGRRFVLLSHSAKIAAIRIFSEADP